MPSSVSVMINPLFNDTSQMRKLQAVARRQYRAGEEVVKTATT
jgi:hypothetical protein